MANEYLTSSNFADVAGSILSKRKSDYKSQAKKAVGLSLINNFLGQANQGLIQEKEDAINEVADKYNDIFKLNEEEFTSTYWQNNRNRLREFNKNQDAFLNKEALEYLSTTDEAVTAMFGGKKIDATTIYQEPDPELRKQMLEAFNAKRQEIANEMATLQNDPRATMQTSIEYNKLAKAEYLAALEAVKDDPRKKSLMKKAWNRIFRREEDPERAEELREVGIDIQGDIVSTNPAVIELEDNLKTAKENRNTFRDSIDNRINATYAGLDQLEFEDLIKFKDSDKANIILTISKEISQSPALKETYGKVDAGYHLELINDVLREQPTLTTEQVQSAVLMKLIKNEKSTDEYLTRDGMKQRNGRLLIEDFEKLTNETDKKEFLIGNNGFNIYKLMDAYTADNQASMAGNLALQYENIIKPVKDFKINEADLVPVLDRMRTKIDTKKYKDLLGDSSAMGTLGRNVLYNINNYKRNNPNWEQEINPIQLEDAAIFYVMDEYDNNSFDTIGLSKADILAQETFSLDVLEDLPEYIEELQDNKRTNILEFRNYLVQEIDKQELTEDDMLYFKNQVDQDFEDAGVLKRDEDGTINIEEKYITKPKKVDTSNFPFAEVGENTQAYIDKGLIVKQGAAGYRLQPDIFKNAVDTLDLSNVSMDNLITLYRIGSKADATTGNLGINPKINLARRVLSKDSEHLQNAAFIEMAKRFKEEAPDLNTTESVQHVYYLLNNGVQLTYGPKTYHTARTNYMGGPLYAKIEKNYPEYSYSNAKENITPMKETTSLSDVFDSLNNYMLNIEDTKNFDTPFKIKE